MLTLKLSKDQIQKSNNPYLKMLASTNFLIEQGDDFNISSKNFFINASGFYLQFEEGRNSVTQSIPELFEKEYGYNFDGTQLDSAEQDKLDNLVMTFLFGDCDKNSKAIFEHFKASYNQKAIYPIKSALQEIMLLLNLFLKKNELELIFHPELCSKTIIRLDSNNHLTLIREDFIRYIHDDSKEIDYIFFLNIQSTSILTPLGKLKGFYFDPESVELKGNEMSVRLAEKILINDFSASPEKIAELQMSINALPMLKKSDVITYVQDKLTTLEKIPYTFQQDRLNLLISALIKLDKNSLQCSHEASGTLIEHQYNELIKALEEKKKNIENLNSPIVLNQQALEALKNTWFNAYRDGSGKIKFEEGNKLLLVYEYLLAHITIEGILISENCKKDGYKPFEITNPIYRGAIKSFIKDRMNEMGIVCRWEEVENTILQIVNSKEKHVTIELNELISKINNNKAIYKSSNDLLYTDAQRSIVIFDVNTKKWISLAQYFNLHNTIHANWNEDKFLEQSSNQFDLTENAVQQNLTKDNSIKQADVKYEELDKLLTQRWDINTAQLENLKINLSQIPSYVAYAPILYALSSLFNTQKVNKNFFIKGDFNQRLAFDRENGFTLTILYRAYLIHDNDNFFYQCDFTVEAYCYLIEGAFELKSLQIGGNDKNFIYGIYQNESFDHALLFVNNLKPISFIAALKYLKLETPILLEEPIELVINQVNKIDDTFIKYGTFDEITYYNNLHKKIRNYLFQKLCLQSDFFKTFFCQALALASPMPYDLFKSEAGILYNQLSEIVNNIVRNSKALLKISDNLQKKAVGNFIFLLRFKLLKCLDFESYQNEFNKNSDHIIEDIEAIFCRIIEEIGEVVEKFAKEISTFSILPLSTSNESQPINQIKNCLEEGKNIINDYINVSLNKVKEKKVEIINLKNTINNSSNKFYESYKIIRQYIDKCLQEIEMFLPEVDQINNMTKRRKAKVSITEIMLIVLNWQILLINLKDSNRFQGKTDLENLNSIFCLVSSYLESLQTPLKLDLKSVSSENIQLLNELTEKIKQQAQRFHARIIKEIERKQAKFIPFLPPNKARSEKIPPIWKKFSTKNPRHYALLIQLWDDINFLKSQLKKEIFKDKKIDSFKQVLLAKIIDWQNQFINGFFENKKIKLNRTLSHKYLIQVYQQLFKQCNVLSCYAELLKNRSQDFSLNNQMVSQYLNQTIQKVYNNTGNYCNKVPIKKALAKFMQVPYRPSFSFFQFFNPIFWYKLCKGQPTLEQLQWPNDFKNTKSSQQSAIYDLINDFLAGKFDEKSFIDQLVLWERTFKKNKSHLLKTFHPLRLLFEKLIKNKIAKIMDLNEEFSQGYLTNVQNSLKNIKEAKETSFLPVSTTNKSLSSNVEKEVGLKDLQDQATWRLDKLQIIKDKKGWPKLAKYGIECETKQKDIQSNNNDIRMIHIR